MKNLLFTLCLLIGSLITVRAQSTVMQYEVHRFMAHPGQTDLFEKGLAAHNKKFHNAAPYKTSVFSVHTGPNSGAYELALGPMTFAQMENRPASDEHNTDWEKNVLAYADPIGETVYWRTDNDISYLPAGSDAYNYFRWRYNYLIPGQMERYKEIVKKVNAVFTTKKYPVSFRWYSHFGASQGPHVCTEIGMASWSFFDGPGTWEKDFEEVHGLGSMARFNQELELCVDRTKTYDELVKYESELSSD